MKYDAWKVESQSQIKYTWFHIKNCIANNIITLSLFLKRMDEWWCFWLLLLLPLLMLLPATDDAMLMHHCIKKINKYMYFFRLKSFSISKECIWWSFYSILFIFEFSNFKLNSKSFLLTFHRQHNVLIWWLKYLVIWDKMIPSID